MKIDLSGRIALVTGGADGIGRGCVQVLAKAGATVVINDINEDKGTATCNALGSSTRFVRGDVTVEDDLRGLVSYIESEFGKLDVLVNNAGVTVFKPLVETESSDWSRIIDLDLRSVHALTRACLPLLEKSQAASVINIASVHAQMTVGRAAIYAAAKGGVVSMTRALCQELAPLGIRINCVSPGFILTPFIEGRLEARPNREERLQHFNSLQPLGRTGTPRDVGNLVTFLASEYSSFITGANLTLDGGATACLSL
jgi:NAD(P)-dependent dehydrogenase (short-subunit alcohol dehydrogenase family)